MLRTGSQYALRLVDDREAVARLSVYELGARADRDLPQLPSALWSGLALDSSSSPQWSPP